MSEVKFKGFAQDGERELIVDRLFTDPRLLTKAGDDDKLGIRIAPSDAPALALAILEAAGVEAKPSNDDPGTPGNLGRIAYQLMIHIEDAENITAEAEAQAKLEAEALELRNEYFNNERAWSDLNDDGQTLWLRMARKARELGGRAEK